MLTKFMLTVEERAAIGDLVAASAWLESVVGILIEQLAKLERHAFGALVEGAMLGKKLEALQTLGDYRIESESMKEEFHSLLERARSLNSERNIVVHGQWQPKGGASLGDYFGWQPGEKPMEFVQTRRIKGDKSLDASRVVVLGEEFHLLGDELLMFGILHFIGEASADTPASDAGAGIAID